ncbi:MAG: 4-hydroxy-tetrahydrodipicolinate reductase, partial [Eubacterium sp.]|nr:4-hydroxy-tetrahydrodipicolinate reductase [Eubacterium sp.]
MLKIILTGCNGFMGRVLTDLIRDEKDLEAVAGIDITQNPSAPYPVYASLSECPVEADVAIDFSTASAVDALLDACVEKKLPVVLCTTGLSEAQLEKVRAASEEIPILRSANMSLGINLLLKLVGEAAKILANAGFDM